MMKNNDNGITLVALVVTIIVILILAGISINMLTGQNGILNRTSEAKEKTLLSQKQEKSNLANMEEIINSTIEGKKIEQINDSKPGVLEKEDSNIYVINSIEDLVFLSYDVRNGNTYEGKTVKLGSDLDFNSVRSYVDPFRTDYSQYGYNGELKTLLTTGEGFIPIGKTSDKSDQTIKAGNFAGTFDGNNHIISNCYINKNTNENDGFYLISFFGAFVYGEIKNLGLYNVNYNLKNQNNNAAISGITAYSMKNAIIKNCFVTGSINQESSGTGMVACSGIATFSKGVIENSYSLASLYGKVNNPSAGCYISGIAIGQEGNYIKNCYNSGEITAKGNGKYYEIGGIVRNTGKSETKIQNSYNSGDINLDIEDFYYVGRIGGILAGNGSSPLEISNTFNSGKINISFNNIEATALKIAVGGIIGDTETGDTVIKNCYNIGSITNGNSNDKFYIGAIFGCDRNNVIINNCYYLKSIPYNGVGKEVSSAEKINITQVDENQKQEMLAKLNENNIWKSDDKNINNSYPILYWQ